jgi:amidase
MSELHYETLAAVAQQIQTQAVSPTALTEVMLDRIAQLNPSAHAYTCVMSEQARAQAQAAEQEINAGTYRGQLHGVPIAVKDLLDVEGVPTTCGSTIRQNAVASHDATVIAKLRAAGAVILGKLNMTEFALSGYHRELPVPVNPWGADRWAGVSSSGSGVATALGMAFGTLGSDTGGSIRFPSAVNGVVGIKPTFGTVSKAGAFPLSYTLDHVGPIARGVEDAAILLQAIAGHDPHDPFTHRTPVPDYLAQLTAGVRGLRIGVDETYCANDADPEVTQATLNATRVLEELGAILVPVNVMPTLAVAPFWGAVVAAEAAVAHADTYPSQAGEYGPVFGGLLEAAPSLTASDYAQARLATAQAQSTFDAVFADVDLLVCPGAPSPAMPLSEFGPTDVLPPEAVASFVGFCAPMNFTGIPTVSVPCGFSIGFLPIGLQFVGPRHAEPLLIQAAYAYEQATTWHTAQPPEPS